jgi:hypothetical protein
MITTALHPDGEGSNTAERYRIISTSSTHALNNATIRDMIKNANQSRPPLKWPLRDMPASSRGTVAP